MSARTRGLASLQPASVHAPRAEADSQLSGSFLRLAAGAAALLFVLAVACGPAEEERTPESSGAQTVAGSGHQQTRIESEPGLDVLLITIDTLRADALGAYGDSEAATPWMDRLARAGVRFDNARAHGVTTLPSHATILSGLYPQEHGVRDNSGFRFPQGVETLATILGAEGYRTGAFISAFPLDSRFGLSRGFDVYDDDLAGKTPQVAFQLQERSGIETVGLAKAWLDEGGAQPSFAWVHLFEPHFPYSPPASLAERFRADPYRGDVAAADAALEPLLAPILELGTESDTLVALTSDHGEALGEHGEPTHGIFAYESVLKVPLILHQPRLLPASVLSQSVGLVDLPPTILELVAVEAPSSFRGRSLVPMIEGADSTADRGTYFEALSAQLNLGWAPLHGIVRNDWKYIRLPIPELYDLASDPGETVNLADADPERLRALAVDLEEILALDRGARPDPESADTRRRLQSLGYLGSAGAPTKTLYSEDDDPKRLIPLFRALREVADHHAAGDLEKARSICRELISQRPGMRMAHIYLGQIERDLGNLDAAANAMRTALELKPDDTQALALLASCLLQAGRADEARQATEEHARLDAPDPDVMLARSLALARAGRQTEALGTLERTRSLDPENPTVHVYLGTLHLLNGQRSEARAAYERALALDSEIVRAHTSLAMMATEEGRLDDALDHWRRALTIDPGQSAVLYSVASGLWNSGQPEPARRLLGLFVDSAPSARFEKELGHARRLLETR